MAITVKEDNQFVRDGAVDQAQIAWRWQWVRPDGIGPDGEG